MEDCGKTYIAEYGTEEPCELKDTDCIIHRESISYLGLEENSTLTEVLAAYRLALQHQNIKIQELENQLNS